jgi:hypothetical protein
MSYTMNEEQYDNPLSGLTSDKRNHHRHIEVEVGLTTLFKADLRSGKSYDFNLTKGVAFEEFFRREL